MDNRTTLNSTRLSEIWTLLESDFVPISDEEMVPLLHLAALPNRALQDLILRVASRSPSKFSTPLLAEISCHGLHPDTRRNALRALLPRADPQVLPAILACANDEDPETQLIALKALRGHKDHRALDLLIDRLEYPARGLPPNDPSRAQDVKRAVVESLATPGAVQSIDALVGLMVREPALRATASESLASIGGTQVVEALLSATQAPPAGEKQPDALFKLEVVRVIARLSLARLARGQLNRLRILLADILPEAIKDLPARRYVLGEIASRLDASLLQIMIDAFARNADTGIGTEIVTALSQVDINRTLPFWLKAFDVWPPSNRAKITDAFREAAARDPSHATAFLQAALVQVSPAHQADRIPHAFESLASSMAADITLAIARLLDTRAVRDVALPYLEKLWSVADAASRVQVVERLCAAPYSSSEATDLVVSFFAPRWNDPTGDDGASATAFQVILRLWDGKDTLKPRIASVLQGIASKQASTPRLVDLIVARAAAIPACDPHWDLLSSCMDRLNPSTLADRLDTCLRSSWHHGLMARLVQLDAMRATTLLVLHISGGDTTTPLQSDERLAALDWLGEVGTSSEFGLLRSETDTGSTACAEAATKAIASIDPDAGEGILRDLLESRKPRVVTSALEGLEKVQSISPVSVAAILRRTESERSREIQVRARRVLDSLLSRHLQARPTAAFEAEAVVPWLEVLSSFPPSAEAGNAIHMLVEELGEREAPDLRIALARAAAKCCPPDLGISLAERELQTERRPDVVSAWEDALDSLMGSPDRSLLSLVHRVCGVLVDLGDKVSPLQDTFCHPELTLPGLMQGLRRAEKILEDADGLVAQLDATAELLIDELLWSIGEEPERFDTYSNKIGRSKSISVKAMRHAQNLHNLRELAQGPHARDATGNLRPGIEPNEAQDARAAFAGTIREVVAHISKTRQLDRPKTQR